MSASLKAAEITVRVIVLIFQILALLGGALLLGLYPEKDNAFINGVGVATIVVAMIILIYEVLMIIFALIDHVNHSARLLVDIILNSVMAGLTILTTIGVIILAVILLIFLIAFAGIVIAIFALPIGLGVIFSILFIVSAISAGIIRSKLINEARELQPSSIVVAPPPGPTFVLVQQPTTVGQPGVVYPPSYDTTFGQAPAIPVTSDPAATGAKYNYGHQPGYQAGYPLATGTGDQNVQNPTAVSYGQKVPAQ